MNRFWYFRLAHKIANYGLENHFHNWFYELFRNMKILSRKKSFVNIWFGLFGCLKIKTAKIIRPVDGYSVKLWAGIHWPKSVDPRNPEAISLKNYSKSGSLLLYIFAMATHVTVNSVVDWGHMWFGRPTCKSFIMVLAPRVKQQLWVDTDSGRSMDSHPSDKTWYRNRIQ